MLHSPDSLAGASRARAAALAPRLVILAVAALLPIAAAAQVFVFHLDGGQEVPPVPSPASGGCWAELDQPASELEIVCTHDVEGATLIHIHYGAPGVNGSPAFDMGDPASPVHATWTGMTPADVADLLAGDLYVNIHTSGRPAGEIRGQLLPRTIGELSFPLEGDQQVPPATTNAAGSCLADLSEDATTLAVACEHTVADPTTGHLHRGAAGTNGPVVFTFADPTSPMTENVPLVPEQVANLVGRLLYVNVHSLAVPDGEIRGQVVDAPLFADGFETGSTAAWSNGTALAISTFAAQCPGDCLFGTGETITFDVVVSGNPTLFEYDWDGNGTFEESSPTVVTTHAYALPGSYVPRLRITRNAASQTATHAETIFVGAEE